VSRPPVFTAKPISVAVQSPMGRILGVRWHPYGTHFSPHYANDFHETPSSVSEFHKSPASPSTPRGRGQRCSSPRATARPQPRHQCRSRTSRSGRHRPSTFQPGRRHSHPLGSPRRVVSISETTDRFSLLPRIPSTSTRTRASSCAPVAQPDRASGFEPEGRGFESLPACHLSYCNSSAFLFHAPAGAQS
jgi:hypothetical protein